MRRSGSPETLGLQREPPKRAVAGPQSIHDRRPHRPAPADAAPPQRIAMVSPVITLTDAVTPGRMGVRRAALERNATSQGQQVAAFSPPEKQHQPRPVPASGPGWGPLHRRLLSAVDWQGPIPSCPGKERLLVGCLRAAKDSMALDPAAACICAVLHHWELRLLAPETMAGGRKGRRPS